MSPADAREYLEFYETGLGREILRREADYVRAWLGGCKRILDVGCGPGVFEEELKELDITGVDSSPEMLEAARAIADNQFVLGSAEELPFTESSFDGLFFITSLEFTSDYQKALAEAARVLSKGGRLLVLMFNPGSAYFKGMLAKEGYTKMNIQHTNMSLENVEGYISKRFGTTGEYVLGIDGGRISPSQHPRHAALYAIKGSKE